MTQYDTNALLQNGACEPTARGPHDTDTPPFHSVQSHITPGIHGPKRVWSAKVERHNDNVTLDKTRAQNVWRTYVPQLYKGQPL